MHKGSKFKRNAIDQIESKIKQKSLEKKREQWKVQLNPDISKHDKYSTSNAVYAYNIPRDCVS